MAEQDPSSIKLYASDPTYLSGEYIPVSRPDQFEAITNYLSTGTAKQSVNHKSGKGKFTVTFKGFPDFSYEKDNDGKPGGTVKLRFATPKLIHTMRAISSNFGGSRRTTKRSKKARRTTRRH